MCYSVGTIFQLFSAWAWKRFVVSHYRSYHCNFLMIRHFAWSIRFYYTRCCVHSDNCNLLNCSLQPQNPLIFWKYQQSTLPGCCRAVLDLLWKFYRLTKESEKWSMINAIVFISFLLYLLHHQYSGLFRLLVKFLKILAALSLIWKASTIISAQTNFLFRNKSLQLLYFALISYKRNEQLQLRQFKCNII